MNCYVTDTEGLANALNAALIALEETRDQLIAHAHKSHLDPCHEVQVAFSIATDEAAAAADLVTRKVDDAEDFARSIEEEWHGSITLFPFEVTQVNRILRTVNCNVTAFGH